MRIDKNDFGISPSGKKIYLFRVWYDAATYFDFTNYGATWVSAVVPDKDGNPADVLLGYHDPDAYIKDTACMGCTVGRFANRIAGARFELNGKVYLLDKNDGDNTNHGGFAGFHKRVFESEVRGDEIVFSLFSPDGEGGYPGNLLLKVFFGFSPDYALTITYEASADQDTWVNLTNHAYFNLHGQGKIHDHHLQIPSTMIVSTDDQFIPTGEIPDVAGTSFDFTTARRIGDVLSGGQRWVLINRGLNHCYILPENEDGILQQAAVLSDLSSGRSLIVRTTQPAVIAYSAGFLSSGSPGKNGRNYTPWDGFCLETQCVPDAPNQPAFRQGFLPAHAIYRQRTEYKFSVE